MLAAALCASAEPYKIILPTSPDDEGAMGRLVNYDSGATIDSVLAGPQSAVFTGSIDEPVLARIMMEGRRNPVFILESGTISFSQASPGAFGTMLNDQLKEFGDKAGELGQQFNAAGSAEERQAIYARYQALGDSLLNANSDNALGYYAFLNNDLSSMSIDELNALLERYPQFAAMNKVKNIAETAVRRQATQPGGKFIDFEITNDGVTKRLSDYVGNGKYVLVDFWASWCGPCMRQLPVLKDIYNKWHDSGLEVLGVAVWDQPEDTRRAITEHELPWDCIINAGNIPTDLYGISGIPCIILFGPDGTIISRDKQGDELKADVDAAMASARQ